MDKGKNYKEGFELGMRQLQLGKVAQARYELWDALGIHNRNTFALYKKGGRECSATQAANVENVFAKYGIYKVWGR
jgi:hypothetical protein